ncbi:hypothetical protein ACFW9F_23015 [Streptomyces sp. NPDC059506]|uniref:hypothetical protein n=1 Tax=Streptomyces sp. NPDC059506 TaxID=3347751 RepID=UPI00368231FF
MFQFERTSGEHLLAFLGNSAGREETRAIASWHGIIRAQALAPRESLDLIEKLLGEL